MMIRIFEEIPEILKYKELLRNLVIREIKKRYKRSALGFLWVMLDPLLMLLIFYLIFSRIFGRSVGNYAAYVMSGITIWQFFSQGTKVASLSFINNRSLINKLYLPKSIFPLSVVMSSLVHYIFTLVPLLVIVFFSGTHISGNAVFIPFTVGLVFLFSLGLSLAVSTMAVFFHDVLYIYDVLLLAWMYLSATFYPITIIPERFRFLMYFNPVYDYISIFRANLYDNAISLTWPLLCGTLYAVFSFAIGWGIYYKNKDKIVFYL